ncbi:MAG TPA: hypothetical protein VGZ22_00490, partial [Isosphaeraceae bacterium]|nr:hypothetical protein [Isosphaeraceae bacterium]
TALRCARARFVTQASQPATTAIKSISTRRLSVPQRRFGLVAGVVAVVGIPDDSQSIAVAPKV